MNAIFVVIRRLCLTYQETYKLDMALPYKVVDKKGKAAFDKSKKALIVTLPIETVATVSTESSGVTPPPSGITELSSTEQEEQTDSPPKANGTRNKAINRASGENTKQKKHDRWVSEPAEALSSSDTLKKEIMEAAEKAKKEAEIAARTPKAVVAAPKKVVESSASTNSTTAQLDRELAQAADQSKDYIPAIKFVGRKPGYVFHMGDRGLGYYLDTKAPVAVTTTAIPGLGESPLSMPTVASTATEVQRKDIPFEVRERGQTVVFLFQVAQIVADSVHISRNNHQIAIRFDAIAPEDITGSNKLHFGNVFDFSSVVAAAVASGNVTPLFSGVTHDVAAKNMVLLLTKAAPGTLSTDAQEKWVTTLPYAEVKEAAPVDPVDSTQNVTSTAANTTPVKSPSKSVASTTSATAATPSAAPATSTSSSTPSTATVKSLISSLQFSSDLVNELD